MNKQKLVEITYTKLSSDKSFMAYYLEQFKLTERKTRENLLKLLHCSLEDYYKLGLCKAPDPLESNFSERILKISAYSNASFHALTDIIERVYVNENAPLSEESTLIPKTKTDNFEEKIKQLTDIFPLPSWITNIRLKIYQAALTTFLILTFVFNSNVKGQESNIRSFYEIGNANYKDSIRYISLRDNTFVKKPGF